MKETAQQYTERILSHIDGKDPIKVQKSTPKKLEKLTRRLGKKEMRRRPAPGNWSIGEILAHLADAEVVGSWRIRQVLGADATPIQAYDQNVWAKTFRYEDRDPKQSLKVFRVLRENNLSLLKSVPRQLWENHGIHAERGKETIAQIVRMFAGHDLNHLQQIERIAKAGRR